MADHEIRIHPTVNLQEIKDLERHLELVRQQMDRIAGSAAKITIPSTGSTAGRAHGQAGRTGTQTGGGSFVPPRPGETTVQDAVQHHISQRTSGARRVMEAQQQAQQARTSARGHKSSTGTASAETATTPGGLLNWIMSVFLPDQPTIQEMTGGAKGLNMSKLSPSLRAKMPTFQFQPSAWKSAPQTPSEYADAAAAIPGFDTMSPAAQKAAMDAAMGGYTPVNLDQLRKQGMSQQQALYQAYKQGGASGGGSGTSWGLGAGPKAMLDAAGIGGTMDILGRLGPWGAAALGVGYLGKQGVQGWSNYRIQGTAFSAISKSAGDLGESFNTLRDAVNKTGVQFAESLTTITQVAQTYIPYAGDLSTKALTGALTASQGLAFSYGLNPVSTTQAFGQAAQMGITGTAGSAGQMTPPQWAALIANATTQGNMQGRTGQVLSSMLSVSQNIASTIAQAPNQNLLASMMTTLNRSGNALLQGTNGAGILNSINSGMISPGAGSAGELAALMINNPNGKLSYWQTRYEQDQGLNGVNPTTGVGSLAATLQYFQKMLPGAKLRGTTKNGVWSPSTQSAYVASQLSEYLFHTVTEAPKALQILKAFQGQGASAEDRTQQLAQQLGGPTAVSTLLKKGGINVFGQIANATNVHQLTAAAHDITGNLHGHVSAAYYTAQKQYEALSKIHPTSAKQAADIAHQRALDFTRMKDTLGKSVLSGPSLMTSVEQLNKTIAATQKNWTTIAHNIAPLALDVSKIAKAISTPGKTIQHYLTKPPTSGWTGDFLRFITQGQLPSTSTLLKHIPGAAKTTAYQPWIGRRTTATPSAQLADFIMGNMQPSGGVPILNGNNAGMGVVSASYSIPANQKAFVKQMQPYANQVSRSTGLSPQMLLTQWGLESGWGTSTAAQQNDNFGGIKPWGSYGPGADSNYAGYSSLSAFAKGDAAFYNKNSNYRALETAARAGASTQQQIKMLGQSGYATDPAYAQKLLAVLSQIENALSNTGIPLTQA